MDDLEMVLRRNGLFDSVKAYADKLGKPVKEALNSLPESIREPEPFTVHSPDYVDWYNKTKAALGKDPKDSLQVVMYRMFGKLWATELTSSEWAELEAMYGNDTD